MTLPLVRAVALCLIGACVASAHLTGSFGHDLGHELFGTHFDWVHSYASDSYASITEQGGRPFDLDLTASPHKDTVLIPCFWDFIKPCGNVTVQPEGTDFKTPFGTYHAPGEDNAFSAYMGYTVLGLLVVHLIYNVARPKNRKVLKEQFDFMKKGGLKADSPAHKKMQDSMSPEDKKEEEKDSKNPKSANFICPGNIYRLLSVLVPGKGGMTVHKYVHLMMKGGICAYMQIYMPFNIMCFCFTQWSYAGVKSPLWFVPNFTTFLASFAALGNVCTIFTAKCSAEIDLNAEACFYLLSMDEGDGDAAKAGEKKKKAPLPFEGNGARKKTGGNSSLETPLVKDVEADAGASGGGDGLPSVEGAENALFNTPFMKKALAFNEVFWCAVNMLVTISSSLLLNITMIFKVATFTGDVANIAVIALSLYFIFELDDKVMKSNPDLKPQYRLEVLKQTKPKEEKDKPFWVKKVASCAIHLLHLMLPAGLLMIILISWQEQMPFGKVRIGGDPFNQMYRR